MVFGDVFEAAVVVVVAALLFHNVRKFRREKREAADAVARGEALFASMFPELQPWFHPEKALRYVQGRRGRAPPAGRERWEDPPGFGAHAAELDVADGKERVTLLDAAGAKLGQFLYEEKPDGGVLRIGKGKMTVVLPADGQYRVRYWHPDREFKWKRGGQWTFDTRVSDSSIDSGSRSTSFSESSSSSAARGAAAATGTAAAGGAFDGGGANASWDDSASGGGSGGDSGSGAFEGGTASATSY